MKNVLLYDMNVKINIKFTKDLNSSKIRNVNALLRLKRFKMLQIKNTRKYILSSNQTSLKGIKTTFGGFKLQIETFSISNYTLTKI